jgi:Fe-S-cluster containining protein
MTMLMATEYLQETECAGDVEDPFVVIPRTKPHREDLRTGECLCTHCPAKCCRYYATPIDTPTNWQEFDYLRWFLYHKDSAVFLEDGCWYLLVFSKCMHLRDDNLCGAYETRPQVCRDYGTANCEYEEEWVYDHYFETAEQVEEYAEAVLPPRKGRTIRSPKP